jgi:hypothetical protein
MRVLGPRCPVPPKIPPWRSWSLSAGTALDHPWSPQYQAIHGQVHGLRDIMTSMSKCVLAGQNGDLKNAKFTFYRRL